MDIRKEEYLKVLDKFPDVFSIGGDNFHLHLEIINEVMLEVDFRKYPRKMKAYLVKNNKKKFKLSRVVSSLRYWDEHSAVSVLEIIEEILLLIDNLKLKQIMIKKDFLEGLADMCKQIHPKKIRGVLGVHKGIVSEYIPRRVSIRRINPSPTSICTSGFGTPHNIITTFPIYYYLRNTTYL